MDPFNEHSLSPVKYDTVLGIEMGSSPSTRGSDDEELTSNAGNFGEFLYTQPFRVVGPEPSDRFRCSVTHIPGR
jgi:hypothetical protein